MKTVLVIAAAGALIATAPVGHDAAAAAAASSGWSLQAMPTSGGNATTLSVSCTSQSNCIAVGDTFVTDYQVLTEHWDGTTWTVVPAPEPGSGSGMLESVSCTGPQFCLAVGVITQPPPGRPSATGIPPLVERYDGQAWHLAPGPSSDADMTLESVSCSAAASCDASGYAIASNGLERPVVVYWNGSTWTNQAAAGPPGPSSANLTALSCTGASQCTAVGVDRNGRHGSGFPKQFVFAEQSDGSSFALQRQPNPVSQADYNTNYAVSCDPAASCMSVGSWYSGAQAVHTLAESWNGSSWTMTTPPSESNPDAQLFGVSCVSGTCQAVGFQAAGPTAEVGTADLWNGSSWSAETVPSPTGSTQLTAVSCWSTTGCMAIGTSGSAPLSELYAG